MEEMFRIFEGHFSGHSRAPDLEWKVSLRNTAMPNLPVAKQTSILFSNRHVVTKGTHRRSMRP
ncbi:MAG: hypothetical protein LC123_16570 [Burkholderiales bacterium]|nr:hypothetical protein [Burkholderiales bacterium]